MPDATTPTRKRSRPTSAEVPAEHPPEDPTRDAPTNVIAALARVQAEIGGIEKLTTAQRKARGEAGGEQGVSYAYRGIDQVAAAAQPLFGRYGIVIVPEIGAYDTEVVMVGRQTPMPWTHATLTVHWTIYGPGGVDDHITARTIGEGRDNSDKTANKAMTGAYKNLLLRLLTIGDPTDEGDAERHETEATPPPPDPNVAEATRVYERILEVAKRDDGQEIGRRLGEFGKVHGRRFAERELRDAEWRGMVEVEVDRLLAVADQPEEPEAMGNALADELVTGDDGFDHEGYGS